MTSTVYGLSATAVSLKSLEGIHIKQVMTRMEGNISRSSKVLGISRPGLYNKIKFHGIDVNEIKKPLEE